MCEDEKGQRLANNMCMQTPRRQKQPTSLSLPPPSIGAGGAATTTAGGGEGGGEKNGAASAGAGSALDPEADDETSGGRPRAARSRFF